MSDKKTEKSQIVDIRAEQINEELKEEVRKCLEDDRGYYVFITHLTQRKDRNGNWVLDFKTLRREFFINDISKALKVFADASAKELGLRNAKIYLETEI